GIAPRTAFPRVSWGKHGGWVGGFALKGSASGREKRTNGAGADGEGMNPNEPWPALAPHRAANGGLDLGALGGVALPKHRTGGGGQEGGRAALGEEGGATAA